MLDGSSILTGESGEFCMKAFPSPSSGTPGRGFRTICGRFGLAEGSDDCSWKGRGGGASEGGGGGGEERRYTGGGGEIGWRSASATGLAIFIDPLFNKSLVRRLRSSVDSVVRFSMAC